MRVLEGNEQPYPTEYDVYVICSNCDKVFHVAIPKGSKIPDHMERETCPHCGCSGTLKKA